MMDREAMQAYARLDQVGALITPRLTWQAREAFLDAVLASGSIAAMPEPFRSWCEDPDNIPNEFLEQTTPDSTG